MPPTKYPHTQHCDECDTTRSLFYARHFVWLARELAHACVHGQLTVIQTASIRDTVAYALSCTNTRFDSARWCDAFNVAYQERTRELARND